jgi:hypothetical protein
MSVKITKCLHCHILSALVNILASLLPIFHTFDAHFFAVYSVLKNTCEGLSSETVVFVMLRLCMLTGNKISTEFMKLIFCFKRNLFVPTNVLHAYTQFFCTIALTTPQSSELKLGSSALVIMARSCHWFASWFLLRRLSLNSSF